MIARVWHGWTLPVNADKYQHYLETRVLPHLRELAGHAGAQVLRREDKGEIEFVTLTMFESIDAVRRFAGDNYQNAVVPEEAQKLLSHFDRTCGHYEIAVNTFTRS